MEKAIIQIIITEYVNYLRTFAVRSPLGVVAILRSMQNGRTLKIICHKIRLYRYQSKSKIIILKA